MENLIWFTFGCVWGEGVIVFFDISSGHCDMPEFQSPQSVETIQYTIATKFSQQNPKIFQRLFAKFHDLFIDIYAP